jgi:D-3-phosphoglycerate dehydrogenase / 2-oxoglutarate reductase
VEDLNASEFRLLQKGDRCSYGTRLCLMKVLVADKISASGVQYLKDQEGIEVIEAYGLTEDQLVERVVDIDAIIVRSATTITSRIIAEAQVLKAVARAGVGVDNIDVPAATEKGVIVMNTPSGNTIATAELAFTHLLCSARPVAQANASMKSGKWDKKAFEGTELYQKALGILGLGRIGTEVARRAKAFGMEVLAFDPFLTDARADQLGVSKTDLDTLFAKADFITVHMPKTDATENLLNKAAFAKMKKGVRIVNCARGGLINEADLAEALKEGKVAAAGLDVFEVEPLAGDSSLRAYDRVVLTPHLGASTAEAQENVGLEAAELISDVLKGGWVRNAVNAPSVDPETLKALRPYLGLAHRLGSVIQTLSPDEVSKMKITYSGKLVELDVKPLNRAIQRGYLQHITNDVNDVNAPNIMRRLGIEGEVIKSSLEREYTELIRLEVVAADGETYSIEGTLIGKSQTPRMTQLNGRDVECPLDATYLLVLENQDVPGIVGMVGTLLAKHQINISNMSLSRNTVGGIALNICGIDSKPDASVLDEIRANPAIKTLNLVELGK